MSASNSQNMTVAAKLALNLKESPLGTLLGPDEVEQLAKDAIQQAFFEKRRVPPRNSWGSYEEADPVIVDLARDSFKASFDEAVKPVIAEIVASGQFREALMMAAAAAIPDMLRTYGNMLANETMNKALTASLEQAQTMIRSIAHP